MLLLWLASGVVYVWIFVVWRAKGVLKGNFPVIVAFKFDTSLVVLFKLFFFLFQVLLELLVSRF